MEDTKTQPFHRHAHPKVITTCETYQMQQICEYVYKYANNPCSLVQCVCIYKILYIHLHGSTRKISGTTIWRNLPTQQPISNSTDFLSCYASTSSAPAQSSQKTQCLFPDDVLYASACANVLTAPLILEGSNAVQYCER